MFYPNLAQKLLDKIPMEIQFNINIMNEKGIIIASRDKSRINTFHESAYNLIKGNKEIDVLRESDSNLLGVKPGINLKINSNGKDIGVIGVTGEPGEVMGFAFIIKTLIENMLEFENFKEHILKIRDMKMQFIYMLLYENETEPNVLFELAKELGYSATLTRVPIVIKFPGIDEKHKMEKESKINFSQQDIVADFFSDSLIVFKSLGNDIQKAIMKLEEEINGFSEKFDNKVMLFCGIPQNNLHRYRRSAEHAIWLSNKIHESRVSFFKDYINVFLLEQVPLKVYDDIFNSYSGQIIQKDVDYFIELVSCLEENNMNLTKSSQALHMHRNTLLNQLNKIKQSFSINPISCESHRQFLFSFCSYLKQVRSQSQ